MKKVTLKLAVSALALAAGSLAAQADHWPSLPAGVKSGVAGQDGAQVFVGLGSAGDALYSLDTAAPESGWKTLAAFPGPVPSGAASAVAGGKLYVFSGSGKTDPDDASPIIFTDVHAYDPAADAWTKLDTETPVGLLVLTTDKEAEPEKWQKIVDDYMGMPPADYRWNKDVLVYTISTNSWSTLGENPYLPNCGAAVVPEKDGLLLINGEIKPGLRTPQIKHVATGGDSLAWTQLAPLPAIPGTDLQEGLAGAYAGYSHDVLLVAGGANFHGARARSFAEQWFTHDGFPKAWNTEIYARIDGAWKVAGELPAGLAYGASFQVDGGVLAVGGEDAERTARTDVFLMSWDDGKVTLTD